MKKIILVLIAIISLNTFAQEKVTEGVIMSKQTMHSDNETMQAQLASIGEMSTTTYFKNSKSRAEVSNPMSGETTVIIDGDKKEMMMLMNSPYMGKTYGTQSLELSEEDLKNISVTKVEETKTVLGYLCNRYDLVVIKENVETKMTFYTTDKLGVPTQYTSVYGDKLVGFPLYMEMTMNQMGMEVVIKHEVTEIKKEKVDDSKFDMTVPEGYKLMEGLLNKN